MSDSNTIANENLKQCLMCEEIKRLCAHTMRADKLSLCASAAFLNSSMSTFPCASVPTVTIFMPHMAALAGFVP